MRYLIDIQQDIKLFVQADGQPHESHSEVALLTPNVPVPLGMLRYSLFSEFLDPSNQAMQIFPRLFTSQLNVTFIRETSRNT